MPDKMSPYSFQEALWTLNNLEFYLKKIFHIHDSIRYNYHDVRTFMTANYSETSGKISLWAENEMDNGMANAVHAG